MAKFGDGRHRMTSVHKGGDVSWPYILGNSTINKSKPQIGPSFSALYLIHLDIASKQLLHLFTFL